VKAALLEAEAVLAEPTRETVTVADVNGDGRAEILLQSGALAVTVNPAHGGTLSEIAAIARRHDLADVLTRRPEAYHDRLGGGAAAGMRSIHDPAPEKEPGLQRWLTYDRFRRVSLLDGLFGDDGDVDPVEPWSASRLALGEAVFDHAVDTAAARAILRHRVEASESLEIDKRIRVDDATLDVGYRLTGSGGLHGRWGVQWNLALSAGEAPGRYLTAPERPSLGSTGRLSGATEIGLVDEWLGLTARLRWSPPAEVAWGPVETVSVSEAGYERIYQGLALLLLWPLDGPSREIGITLTVETS
jgi:alpha-amylase